MKGNINMNEKLIEILLEKIDKLEYINRQNDMLINNLQAEQVRLNQVIDDLKKKLEIYE